MKLNFYHGIIAVLVVIIFLQHCSGCHQKSDCIDNRYITVNPVQVTAIDTIFQHSVDTIVKTKLKPYAVHQIDSFVAFETMPVDTAAILKDYYSKVYYKDSSLTKWGRILIMDTLTQNRIAGRSVITDFVIPEVIKSITKTVQESKRNQVYIGLMLQGQKSDYLTGFGPAATFKTKSDKIFDIGALYNKNGFVQYQIGLKWKISFSGPW